MKPRSTRVAAYALILNGRRILLCRLSKQVMRWAGHWTLPGGGVEFGEDPEQAMIREVEEETGLKVESMGVAGVDSILDSSGATDRHGIRIIYYAQVVGGVLRNELVGSTDQCAWHELDALPQLRVVDLVKAGLRRLNANRLA